jgi:hypothetical protein
MTKTGRPKTNFYFGLDVGNGNIKIAGDGLDERIPSYRTDEGQMDALGSVMLEGKGYTVGKSALLSQKFIKRTVDDRNAKVDGIESLYLGALAHHPQLPKDCLSRVVVSSHAWQSHKDQIKANLGQQRDVMLAGQKVNLSTEVMMVVPEGFGAVYNIAENCATLDFGTGTTILTPYQKGKPGESNTKHYGVQKLIRLISQEMKVVNGGYPGDEELIRRSLERGEMKVDGVNMTDIYKSCLKLWWNEGLSDLGKVAVDLLKDGYKIICIGGGVALPGFSKVLLTKKFEPITDRPEMANARGLYQLALITAKKRGYYVNE